MAQPPDVSIVIPVGSVDEPFGLVRLQRSLASIGDDPLVEILVVLHGSAPGGATGWLWARAATDPRLVLLGEGWFDEADAAPGSRAYAPRGVAWARNFGIAAAAAPLVAFLDPGDVWLPGKLGAQRALHAGHPSLGFTFTSCRRVGAASADHGAAQAGWPRLRAPHDGDAAPFLLDVPELARLLAEAGVATSTVVARTDLLRALDGFAAELAGFERDLWLRLAACAPVACRPVVAVVVERAAGEAAAKPPAPLGEIVGAVGPRLGRLRSAALRLFLRLAGSLPRPA